MTRSAALTPCRPAADRGFTLLEALSALVLIAVAAVGVAVLVGVSDRATALARLQTTATTAALQKIEQLRSLYWHIDDGLPLSDLSTNLTVDPPAAGGHGLSPSPDDTLTSDVPGYVDYLDARGGWLAGGSNPPPATVLVRRWRVAALAADAANTRVIAVRVLPVARSRQPAGAQLVRNAPGEALLSTLLTRKAR